MSHIGNCRIFLEQANALVKTNAPTEVHIFNVVKALSDVLMGLSEGDLFVELKMHSVEDQQANEDEERKPS